MHVKDKIKQMKNDTMAINKSQELEDYGLEDDDSHRFSFNQIQVL